MNILFYLASVKLEKLLNNLRKLNNFEEKYKKVQEKFATKEKMSTFAIPNENGAIAQLVEQRTENPCVPGSIPGGTTSKPQ